MRSFVSLIIAITTVAACDSETGRSERTVGSITSAKIEEKVANGLHRRVVSAHGPIHVWTPRHYSESGDIVVYVHGNEVTVDEAWKQHALAQQFEASGIDAMFIACEAPSNDGAPVNWASLSELLGTTQKLGIELPKGDVIVAGHSAAHRTIVPWLAESQVDRLVMIDAVYGDVERYRDWLGAKRDRQLIFVGGDSTRAYTEQLHALLPQAKVLEGVPQLGQAPASKIVYVRSDVKHHDLVSSGAVLPVLLQMATEEVGTPVARM